MLINRFETEVNKCFLFIDLIYFAIATDIPQMFSTEKPFKWKEIHIHPTVNSASLSAKVLKSNF